MILVTGTKRSGTSLTMQLLRAAGLPSIGEAFPSDWNATLREANPEGFFESRYRDGIHFLSNPDPETGFYLHPADVRLHAVKVFVPGLTKTDLAFVERVVACVRDVREYDASMRRLNAMEDARDARDAHAEPLPPLVHATPYLEWWRDNYALVVDAMTRRYPLHSVSLHRLVTATESTVRAAIDFVGAGDPDAAIVAVKPSLRTFDRGTVPPPRGLDPAWLPAFDLLFDVLDRGPPDDEAWIDALGDMHLALAARIDEDLGSVVENRETRRAIRVRRGLPNVSEP